MSAHEQAPEWFEQALADRAAEAWVEVRGARIHYMRWGEPTRPALVLVHGGAAHARWWSFLAPLIAQDHYCVLALDLSGHGESDHRPSYDGDFWPHEILGVVADAGVPGKPILVGHSMGGLVSIVTAARHGDRLAGAIIVDSPVMRPDPESEERDRVKAFRNPKVYPDLETALAHFRLVPTQPCDNPWILDHIARSSLRELTEEADGRTGWTWRFDPGVFDNGRLPMSEYLAGVRCRVALFRGELSKVVPPEVGEYMYELLQRNSPLVEIPQAHHHLILDQPLAFVAALRAILADWEHSLPRRRPPAA